MEHRLSFSQKLCRPRYLLIVAMGVALLGAVLSVTLGASRQRNPDVIPPAHTSDVATETPLHAIPPDARRSDLLASSSITTDEITPASLPVSVHELYTTPDRYDGKTLTVRGYYYEATEKVVLTSYVHVGDPTTGWRVISPEQIWLAWDVSPSHAFYDRLHTLPGMGEPDYFGRVEVDGSFHVISKTAGTGYPAPHGAGHLGQYEYTFSIDAVRIFDASTQQYVPIPSTKRRE